MGQKIKKNQINRMHQKTKFLITRIIISPIKTKSQIQIELVVN